MNNIFVTKKNYFIYCGVIGTFLYIMMNIFVPMLWNEYNSLYQTVSEISAIDAPTRYVWLPLGFIYGVLMVFFGIGVVKSARKKHALKISGYLLIVYAFLSLYWPPMHQREILAAGGGTLTDTLHLVWAAISVLFMFLAIGFGAAAFGKGFKIYSISTILFLLIFGIMTSMEAGNVAKDLPTPWIGLWERGNIAVFLLWICSLTIIISRTERLSKKK